MPSIKLLDDDLITKIAAGEVIERPASVVKELVENSLDAGATKVIVQVEDSGKKLIRITDNGQGMDEEDARRCILRHATSKISSLDDLFSINTLGFRGEALAAIAAVSQLSIITKQVEKLEGFNLIVGGGLTTNSGIIAAEKGTVIEVRDLFFNTPARKKFLKTDSVELKHIIDIITNYALINSNIYFKLIHDNHTLLDAPALENPRNNVASIYGVALAKDLLEINFQNELVEIKGFIGKPYQARNDKKLQVLFVNKRLVKNNEISKAVYDGFHSLLFHGKHPLFFLELTLNPEQIDVNVHPQKSEIKIEQIAHVCNSVFTAIKETLQKNNLVPVVEFDFTGSVSGFQKKEAKYSFDPSQQTTLNPNVDTLNPNVEYTETKNTENKNTETKNTKTKNIEMEETAFAFNGDVFSQTATLHELAAKKMAAAIMRAPGAAEPKLSLPPIRLLGQIHKTFFLAETEGGAFFIDQHAAHERVMYERFMKQFMNNEVKTQSLLQGEVLELSPVERAIVEANLQELKQFGFTLEHFGGNSFTLKTIPSIFNRLQPKEAVRELIGSLNGKNTILARKEEIITRMACRSAVMAGDVLTNTWMELILADLAQTDHPYTCPHGRPSIIKITIEELEKKFKRTG